MTTSNTFKREERLKSKKVIESLFEKGKTIDAPPLKIVWLSWPELEDKNETLNSPAQVSFSVPKRAFPKAIDRNRIKRQLREAYRLRKSVLYGFLKNKNLQLALMIIYSGKKLPAYSLIEVKMDALFEKMKSLA